MSDTLDQVEADYLIALDKTKVSEDQHYIAGFGGGLVVPLISCDGREKFILDVTRNRINLQKLTLQTRARGTIPLARLDLPSAPHRNPDGVEICGPHIHLYRAGCGTKWAWLLTDQKFRKFFPHPSDHARTLQDFMRFCHVIDPPKIDFELFR